MFWLALVRVAILIWDTFKYFDKSRTSKWIFGRLKISEKLFVNYHEKRCYWNFPRSTVYLKLDMTLCLKSPRRQPKIIGSGRNLNLTYIFWHDIWICIFNLLHVCTVPEKLGSKKGKPFFFKFKKDYFVKKKIMGFWTNFKLDLRIPLLFYDLRL